MEPLFTPEEFDQASSRQLLSLRCMECSAVFHKSKHNLMKKNGATHKYCSQKCHAKTRRKPTVSVKCQQCDRALELLPHHIRMHEKRGLTHYFCSKQCSGTYNAAHKTTGTRRSKLEVWLQDQLTARYSRLDIHYNRVDAIQAELDIYIPSLKLAFELNGIFHYEPIFGSEKLEATQNKDAYKYHSCTANGIDLCVIDTSSASYFKAKTSERFFKIITSIIDARLEKMVQ